MKTEVAETEHGWKPLFKMGGIAALMMAGIIIVQMIVFMSAPPTYDGGASAWFALFQHNKIIGLIDFELLMIVYVFLSLPITLALYILLRRVSPSFTAIYVVLSLIGIISFIVARPAFEMLSLSNGYAAATTDAERAVYLSAGETLLAVFHGTAFQVSYVLGSLGGFIISLVMLKTDVFSKATAYLRIASSVFDFGLYIPVVGMYISIFSVLFLLVWDILIARRLFQLGRGSA
ncbi:DUF4386 family protein [Chloroflexi bacterium CFX2]|nr:DUF4386 family protein [Chloroflexi bacterium CFX2]